MKLLKFTPKIHENEAELHRKIIKSDEAQFHLGGYVNKQNSRIWGSEKPKMNIGKPLYLQRVTVWCGLWQEGSLGIFENKAGAAVSVNGLHYRTMINEFLWIELEDIDMKDVYLQQDGATYHTNGETISLA